MEVPYIQHVCFIVCGMMFAVNLPQKTLSCIDSIIDAFDVPSRCTEDETASNKTFISIDEDDDVVISI